MMLKELSEAIGVSGNEDAVRAIILKAIEGHVTDIRIDALGSITAIKKGTGSGVPKVMLAAHMDEVGFMVTGFDSDGFIKFSPVGTIDDTLLPGLRVKVGDKQIPGVILWPPIHLGQDQRVVKLKDLRIDIGATDKNSRNGIKSKVKPGDYIAFDAQYMEFEGGMLRGKSFDDRVGCSVLIEVLRGGPYPVDVLAAFTVQEEIGLRGARVAARILKPDIGFALEGTTANDLPNPTADRDDARDHNPVCRVGGGAVLSLMDPSMIVDPRVLRFVRQTAESNGIRYQMKTHPGGGTDAGAIHLSEAGVPSGVISVSCRYIHSPAAILHRDDHDSAVQLVQAVLNNVTFDVLQPL